MHLWLLALVSLPLLLLAYDARLCFLFYEETNRAKGPSAGERPRRLAPDQVSLRHAMMFLIQKANYYGQLCTSLALLVPVVLRPKTTRAEDLALLVMSTSLVTWTKATRREDGSVHLLLEMSGFAFPFVPGRYDCHLVYEAEVRHGAAGELVARTLRFDLDGEAIESNRERISILAIMVAFVAHPVVHSFNNRLYGSHDDPAVAAYDDLFLHGQYLNDCAWYWPGVFFRGIPCDDGAGWVKLALAHNAELALPVHSHRSLGVLAPFSPVIRFLLAARPVYARRRKEFGVVVDGEALYLCTVLHALDHYSCDAYTRGHRFEHVRLPSALGHKMLALMFYRPCQYFFTNLLRDKQHKTPFYAALYQDLRAVDPTLADHVTLSISY